LLLSFTRAHIIFPPRRIVLDYPFSQCTTYFFHPSSLRQLILSFFPPFFFFYRLFAFFLSPPAGFPLLLGHLFHPEFPCPSLPLFTFPFFPMARRASPFLSTTATLNSRPQRFFFYCSSLPIFCATLSFFFPPKLLFFWPSRIKAIGRRNFDPGWPGFLFFPRIRDHFSKLGAPNFIVFFFFPLSLSILIFYAHGSSPVRPGPC